MMKLILVLTFLFAFEAQAVNAKTKFMPQVAGCSFEQFVTKLVQQEKTTLPFHTLIVAENVAHPDGEFWVYWPQLRKFLLVSWTSEACKDPLVAIRKEVFLTKHVVPTEGDIGTSTYLVTEAWTKSILLDAAKDGYQVTIKK